LNAVLAVLVLALGFLSFPPVARADFSCAPMSPNMRAGYLALEDSRYADAQKAFGDAGTEYAVCTFYHAANPNGNPAVVPLKYYWQAYASAGQAAAAFGEGKTTDGLRFAKTAEEIFSDVMNGRGTDEGASADLRRAASDGLAYVRSLASAKQPLLPKLWLDWRTRQTPGRQTGF